MELQGDRLISAPLDKTCAALNNPETLKACIAGCESLERTCDDAFAAVALSAEGASTRLKYNARAQVGGKMVQAGSRLIDAAAFKVAEDFFKAFEEHLRPAELAEVPPAPAPRAGRRQQDAGVGGGRCHPCWRCCTT